MAKRAVTTRRRSSPVRQATRQGNRFTLPVAAILGFAPPFSIAWANFRKGGIDQGARVFARSLTGFDPPTGQWNFSYLREGLIPILVGLGVHKFIGGSLGVNRMLGSAGVPIIRL